MGFVASIDRVHETRMPAPPVMRAPVERFIDAALEVGRALQIADQHEATPARAGAAKLLHFSNCGSGGSSTSCGCRDTIESIESRAAIAWRAAVKIALRSLRRIFQLRGQWMRRVRLDRHAHQAARAEQEGAAELGHQLLEGIGRRAEPPRILATQPLGMARPPHQLAQCRWTGARAPAERPRLRRILCHSFELQSTHRPPSWRN